MAIMIAEALQERLRVVEEEAVRVAQLASASTQPTEQNHYWLLATDLQREARELRREIQRAIQNHIAEKITQ
jgi:hypothetical protein